MIVDDEAGIRIVLGITLSDMGYVVHPAETGEQALELFRNKNPAIVLTDIKMPGMGGIELLQAVKRGKPGCRSDHDDRAWGHGSGCQESEI